VPATVASASRSRLARAITALTLGIACGACGPSPGALGPFSSSVTSQTTALRLEVTNISDTPATYTVTLSPAVDGFDHRTATAEIHRGATVPVSVTVETNHLPPGQYTVAATLTSNLADVDGLSTDTMTVTLTP
jgi:hypothetical protein